MRSEAGQPDREDGQQAQPGGGSDASACPPSRGCEHEEGQGEAARQLDPGPGGQRQRRGARTGGRPRRSCGSPVPVRRCGARSCARQPQRPRQGHQQQRVVVGAADGQHQQDGVQADVGGRHGGRASRPLGRPRRQPDGQQARQGGQGFRRPQPGAEPQRREGVAGEGEQGPVGGALQRPADEGEGRVRGGLGGDVRVGVQAVQGAHAGVVQVAEDVLGDQRRPQRHRQMGQDDPADQQRRRQPPGARQSQQVARAGAQHQDLEVGRAEPRAKARQRSGQPGEPAAGVGWHEAGGPGGGLRSQHDQRSEQQQDAGAAEPSPGCAGGRRCRRGRSLPRPLRRGRLGHVHASFLTVLGRRASMVTGKLSLQQGPETGHYGPCPSAVTARLRPC